MGCFDEESDVEYENWLKSGGECQRCGRKESDTPICVECSREENDEDLYRFLR